MSLINDMLSELEKNKKADVTARGKILSSMGPAIKQCHFNLEISIIAWLIGIIFVIGFIFYYRPAIFFQKHSLNFSRVSSIFLQQQEKPPLPKPMKFLEPVAVSAVGIRLENVFLKTADNQTILDFVLNAPTLYYVDQSEKQKLVITLSNTILPGNLPIQLANSFVTELNTQQSGRDVVVTLSLLDGTKIEEMQLNNQSVSATNQQQHAQLHLVLTNMLSMGGKMSKVQLPILPEQEVEKRFQQAQQLAAQNHVQEAITKLYLLVGDFPDYTEGRESLATLLIKMGDLQKASEVIDVGLRKYSGYTPFIKLKAHILAEQNDINAAVDLMQKSAPPVLEDPEYFSLLASLYQELGQFMKAAELYNQLTKIQPQKTSWWVGLGVALESADKKAAAKEAYQNAYDSSELTPELTTFLETKIKKYGD